MPFQQIMQAVRAKTLALSRMGFLRSVGVLVGGTAVSQAVSVLVLPLVTRFYTPADFSILAVYASILGIVSVVACMRLEIAIPMPARNEEAANLLALALCSCTAVSAAAALVVWVWPGQIVRLVGQPGLTPFLWMLPLGVWLSSVYGALQFWAIRKKNFAAIAKTRMTQAVGGASVQLGFGWWSNFGAFGLLLGQLINSGAGLFGLGRSLLRDDRTVLRKVSYLGMRNTLRDYGRFPKYSTFEAFANSTGTQLPVIIIAAMAVGPEAGYLMLATRVMAVPMALIGGAVSQVYLSRAPDELRAGTLGTFSTRILGGLFRAGVGPLLFAGILAPSVFSFVFGQKWERAGELVTWMTPWFIFQFMSSPISMVMHVTNRQSAMLAVTLSGLIVRLGAMAVAAKYAHNYFSEFYAASGGIFYCICYYIFSRASNIDGRNMIRYYKNNLLPILAWCMAGLMIHIILG